MTQALFFKPSYERLKAQIELVAPSLEIVLFDEEGKFYLSGKEVSLADLRPEYFWIHGELLGSARLQDYFKIMQENSSGGWLHTINTGLDGLPYLGLLNNGMRITNNHSQAISIAEFVMGQVLAWFQNITEFKNNQTKKHWRYLPFREINQSCWLIVGFGHIGQTIARRAKSFGVEIIAVRRSNDDEGLADKVLPLEELNQALPQADVVVMACNSNEKTRGLINKERLALMKPGSVLVNIARGDLVIEQDLRARLDKVEQSEQTLAYAILDVFEAEPLDANSWLWHHPQVAVTPHCSNAGSGMRKRSADLFVENLRRETAGEALLNKVSQSDII